MKNNPENKNLCFVEPHRSRGLFSIYEKWVRTKNPISEKQSFLLYAQVQSCLNLPPEELLLLEIAVWIPGVN